MQIEFDLAGILAKRLEMPLAIQMTEGAFDQGHLHGRRGRMGILGGEALPDAMVVDLNSSHQPVGRTLPDFDPAAPGQKRRIIFDPVHQGKHLFGAVSEQY